MSKLILGYDSINGETIPDGRVHKYVNDVILTLQNPNITSDIATVVGSVVVGSVVIFDAFRVAITEKRLNNKDVIVRFNGKDYELDTEGKISNWPSGLCEVYDDILERLL